MTQARGVQGQLLRSSLIESAYGTNPASMYAVKLPFNSFELKSERNLITPATITGRRDPVPPAQGFTDAAGSVTVPVDQAAIGHWLQMLCGYPATTFVGSAIQHIFKVKSGTPINSFVMEQGFTDIAAYNLYNGVKVDAMTMRVGGDEELTASFDLVAKGDTPGVVSNFIAPTTISLTRYNQFHAALEENDVTISTVRDLEFTVRNNLDRNQYVIGGGATRGGLPEGMCNVSGRFSCLFENWSYYILAMSGTERSLCLTFTAGSFYFKTHIQELIYRRMAPGIPTAEGIYLEMPFEAYYDDGSNASVVQFTLVNTWTAYSGT